MRRQFDLPGGDVGHLQSLGLPWETVVENNVRWLIIHGFPVPPGYGRAEVSVALRIEPNYPDVEIDTVYFDPPLAREDGRAIQATHAQPLDGRSWQRWSRHRTPAGPWRPGEDDLSTHLILVTHWLKRELSRH
jgi:hypothetical protein